MAYIDKAKMVQKIETESRMWGEDYGITDVLCDIEDFPTADVVEVVRCGQCKDFEPHGNGKGGICRNRKCKGLRYATDFCSYGGRRTDNDL